MEENEKNQETSVIENGQPEVTENVNNNTYSTVNSTESKGMSIASLVLGIASFVFMKVSLLWLACGVLAIIFGVKGKKKNGVGMAKAGMILGIISLSIFALAVIAGLFLGASILAGLSSMAQ